MAHSTRTIGIAVASVIALVLIGAAVAFSGPLPFHLTKVDAESTHDLLVSYTAKDSDNDGLPDWEEALYGTDPNNPHSVNQAVTDGQAVAQGLVQPKFATATTSTAISPSDVPGVSAAPTTVTDQFARALFSQYLLSRGSTPPTQEEITAFVQKGVADLRSSQQEPAAFNVGQVKVVGSGSQALAAYATQAENAFAKHTVASTQGELDYYSDAVTKNDATALKKVNEIAKGYTSTAHELIAVPAPHEVAAAHLELANALARIGGVLEDMGAISTDPMRAMIAIGAYDGAHQALIQAFAHMHTAFSDSGVTIPEGTSGYFFYNAAAVGAQVSKSSN